MAATGNRLVPVTAADRSCPAHSVWPWCFLVPGAISGAGGHRYGCGETRFPAAPGGPVRKGRAARVAGPSSGWAQCFMAWFLLWCLFKAMRGAGVPTLWPDQLLASLGLACMALRPPDVGSPAGSRACMGSEICCSRCSARPDRSARFPSCVKSGGRWCCLGLVACRCVVRRRDKYGLSRILLSMGIPIKSLLPYG